MEKSKFKISKKPEKLLSYWTIQWPLCILIVISGLLYNFGMLAFPFFQGVLIDTISDGNKDIVKIVILYVVIILGVQISRAIKRYAVRLFANRASASIRLTLYDNLLHKSEKEMSETKIGTLLARCFSDCDQCVEGMRKLTTEIFDTVMMFLFYIVYLFLFDGKMTAIALIPIAISIFSAFLLRKKIFTLSSESRKLNSKMVNQTYDMFSNALLYRTYSRENDLLNQYDDTLNRYEKKNVASLSLTDTMIPLCDLIALFGLLPILYFGSDYVIHSSNLLAPLPFMKATWTTGSLTTYITTFVLLATKASHTAKLFSSVEKGLSSWKRISPIIKPYQAFDKPVEVKGDTLKVEHLALKTDTRNLIDDLSFELKKGEILGVTGEIASGKSAFGKIFLSDMAYSGKVELFSKEMKDYSPSEIKGTVTYMGHQIQLLTMSLEENILCGEQGDVFPYLKEVSFEKDLQSMPEKEKTIIGNEGVRLSGGQQERIALARTLAHKKPLIVLDDPFASVDKKTEKEIVSHLFEISKDHIIILISHRLSIFPSLSHVLVLHGDGKAMLASHDTLMKEDEVYQKLYHLQEEGK